MVMIEEEGEINLEGCDRPCSEVCQANCWLCRRWSRINLPGITLSNATSARGLVPFSKLPPVNSSGRRSLAYDGMAEVKFLNALNIAVQNIVFGIHGLKLCEIKTNLLPIAYMPHCCIPKRIVPA